MTWESRLKEQRDRQYKNYTVHRLDLSSALDNKEFPFSGDTMVVIGASSAGANATVRLNRTNADELLLRQGKKIQTVFTKFFITCTVQAAWIDLLIGTDFDIDQLDELIEAINYISGAGSAQPSITITNAVANVDTQGASNACNKVLIKAPTSNTGTAWVNFGAAAVAGSCYELLPGSVVSAPTTNTNQVHALFTIANEKVIVIFVE